MKRRDLYNKVAIVLLAIFLVVALKPLWQKTWIYMIGAVMPDITAIHHFTEPHRLLRVGGARWVSWDEKQEGTAYHALVIPPQVEFREDDSISGGDDFTDKVTLRWLRMRGREGNHQEAEAKSLTIVYYVLTQRVSVGAETYRLSEGNIFVVRLDDEWRPHVTQVGAVLDKAAEHEEVVEFFKRVLPDDEAVKKLR